MDDLPDDADEAAAWMKRERLKRGWSTTRLADEARAVARREGSSMALKQQTVSGFEQPGAKRIPEWLRYAKMALEEGAQPREQTVTKRDELVYLRQVDISLSMGAGTELADYPDIQLVPFNLGFVQALSRSPTEKLFLCTGIGGSMEPVIYSHDLVLIDTSQTDLSQADVYWARRYAGQGFIKGLRAVVRDGKRKIAILSANSTWPVEYADPEDVEIVGRVAWIGRRM
jgi:phage repressor protein C with HTH and peptisase S24 domain